MLKKILIFLSLIIVMATLAITVVFWAPFQPGKELLAPATVFNQSTETDAIEKPCTNLHADWRSAQIIDGVEIEESLACEPDNPYDVAVAVKGTNQVSMQTLMQSHFAQDALIMSDDLDADGDPDIIHIKLEVTELNGASPDGNFLINTYDIAPGIQPGLWVFSPKSSGMAVKNFNSLAANPFLRAPSPVIRVEQGDKVYVTLENTHYLPHTIHLHGVDHAAQKDDGSDNDGMEDHPVYPGQSYTYEIQPRHTGAMLYHCHVQTAQHYQMGLNGLFIVEENQPNNWVQTFNIGAGQVRHRSVTAKKSFDREWDLFYQSVDKKLSAIIQGASDPRLVAQRMGRDYNMTESFENYFLLNGHAFPYTLRDSVVITKENEKLKLHLANAQRSLLALHIHGHKATVTAYDGVEQPVGLQVTRDVFDVAPAQRVDLLLRSQNDGLNSYGPGAWMFHDHVPTGTTTDGIEPGGNIAILAYQGFVDDQGMPKLHNDLLDQLFNKDYYTKKLAIWNTGDFAQVLGDAGTIQPNYLQIVIFALALGCLFSLVLVIVRHLWK